MKVVPLSGGKAGATASGRQREPLGTGMTFAFEGFHSWPLSDSTNTTVSVEEMVLITKDGAEWPAEPQKELVLIRSPR